MNKSIIKFHSDPGHGWIEITLSQILDAGLKPSDFSSYSYRDGSKFYLEEDCDAPKFLSAYKINHDVTFDDIGHYDDCFIRDLRRNQLIKI
jgi:hypothetical protein